MPVYFATCGQFVKIGHTEHLWNRLETLQVGVPDYVELLAWIDGGLEAERKIQHKFAAYRQRAEWFKFTDEIAQFARTARQAEFPPVFASPEHWGGNTIFRTKDGWFITRGPRRVRGPYARRANAQRAVWSRSSRGLASSKRTAAE
jgi:hypothetical protein